MTGKILNVDCTSGGTSNIGCGIQDQSTNSFGEQFNKNGGGIFAHLWLDEGIKAWFFLRGQIPKDIIDKQPNPDGWGQPVAFWANTTCNIGQHFSEHSLTLNIALCVSPAHFVIFVSERLFFREIGLVIPLVGHVLVHANRL